MDDLAFHHNGVDHQRFVKQYLVSTGAHNDSCFFPPYDQPKPFFFCVTSMLSITVKRNKTVNVRI